MIMDDNIERIKSELEEARISLHQTVAEVNRKVEEKVETVTQLQPVHLIERNPLLSACLAGAIGFACGYRRNGPFTILLVGGMVAAVVNDVWNSEAPNDGRRTIDSTGPK
jgi:hypothetical protein